MACVGNSLIRDPQSRNAGMVNSCMRIGEYEAWLVVENEKVEHYEVDVNEGLKIASCWVASTAGKQFGVWVKKRHNRFHCRARFFIDGAKSSGRILRDMRPHLLDREVTGPKTYRPLLFQSVDYTDDDSMLISQNNEDPGNIIVRIVHISNCRTRPYNREVDRVDLMNQKVHKNTRKVVTHRVSLGETKSGKEIRSIKYRFHEPVATFVFSYRSLDLLKVNGIAPCDAPAEGTDLGANSSTGVLPSSNNTRKRKHEEEGTQTLPEVDSEDERDVEEEAQLEARLEVIRNARLERKEAKPANKKVKLESKSVFLPGEIIDLTI